MSTVRRTRRKLTPVDIRIFQEEVDDALIAFADDVSYAVAMAREAVKIVRKREIWQARRELRAAEAIARTQCDDHTFECHATSPCGTGDCKFATGEHATVQADSTGTTVRPQALNAGSYDLESAVRVLAERRLRHG